MGQMMMMVVLMVKEGWLREYQNNASKHIKTTFLPYLIKYKHQYTDCFSGFLNSFSDLVGFPDTMGL